MTLMLMRMSQKYNVYSTKAGFKPDQARDEDGKWSDQNTLENEAKEHETPEAFIKEVLNKSQISLRGQIETIDINKISGTDYVKLDEALKINAKLSIEEMTEIISPTDEFIEGQLVKWPIEVVENGEGGYSLYAGNHRLAQKLINRETTILANIYNRPRDVRKQLKLIWERANSKSAVFVKAGFDQNQPRNPDGTWGTGGEFSNSKVRSKDGSLMTVYHGSRKGKFDEFDMDFERDTDDGWLGWGTYFHPDRGVAETYSGANSGNINAFIVSAKLNVENPFSFVGKSAYDLKQKHGGAKGLTKWLKSQGYDGATNGFEWVVFDVDQIKIINDDKKSNVFINGKTKAGFNPSQTRDESGRWSANTSYRGGHAIAPEYAVRLDDLENSESAPRGFYRDLRHYNFSGGKSGEESMRAIRYARNNPKGMIKIFRGVPKGVSKINQGDWISLSKTYATEHATRRAVFSEKPWVVIEKMVEVRDVVYDHNDINEMAYFTSNEKSAVLIDHKAGFKEDQARDRSGKWTDKWAGMRKFENEVKGNDYETAAVYDEEGNQIILKEGEKSSVDFSRDDKIKMIGSGFLLTHNHPNNTSLSEADIHFMFKTGLRKIRAVGESNVYEMSIKAGIDPMKYVNPEFSISALSSLNNSLVESNQAISRSIDKLAQDVLQSDWTVNEKKKKIVELYVREQHQIMEYLANKTDLGKYALNYRVYEN